TKGLDRTGLAILRELSFWREQEARKLNRPRGHVLKDSVLIAISKQQPDSVDQLQGIPSLSSRAIDRWGVTLINGVQAGLSCPEENRPATDDSGRLNKKSMLLLERLIEFIQLKSKVQGIDPTLIGNTTELKQLVRILNNSCETKMVRQMEGWRKTFLNDFYKYAV
ncbi:MAG: HRDC domain-containing protein, partial [Desulfopila sp.]|nr:HRDC domain-containing protein [Desulfopila sp.]